MATPRLTQKDMTEAEQRELKTLLDRARIAHGRTLTNAETNQVKKEYIDKLMAQRETEAKQARKLKKSRLINPIKKRPFLVSQYLTPWKALISALSFYGPAGRSVCPQACRGFSLLMAALSPPGA